MAKNKNLLSIINPKDLEKALNSDYISSSSACQVSPDSEDQGWASALIAASAAIESIDNEENKPKRKKIEEKTSDINQEHPQKDASTHFEFLQLNENNSVTVFTAEQALKNFLEDWGARDRAPALLGETFDSV